MMYQLALWAVALPHALAQAYGAGIPGMLVHPGQQVLAHPICPPEFQCGALTPTNVVTVYNKTVVETRTAHEVTTTTLPQHETVLFTEVTTLPVPGGGVCEVSQNTTVSSTRTIYATETITSTQKAFTRVQVNTTTTITFTPANDLACVRALPTVPVVLAVPGTDSAGNPDVTEIPIGLPKDKVDDVVHQHEHSDEPEDDTQQYLI